MPSKMPTPATALDYESTIITAVELSARFWLVGAQVPSVGSVALSGAS